jgi:endonuclease/exonuclease/phosphatase (EEP) superfamily protein YafD
VIAFYSIAVFFILCSYIHLIKYDAWWIRDFDFIHAQLAVIVSVLLVLGLLLFTGTILHGVVLVLLACTYGYHLFIIIPFTLLCKNQVLTSTNPLNDNSIRVMMCNVYQDNTQYEGFVKLVQRIGPDVLLVVETNSRWAQALSALEADYP